MGIESDHLVYEYLSRVGDLAQRRQLSSGDRMRLVSGLRDEIDRRRAKYEPETPAAVRRILERLGTPEEVLDTVGRPARAAESVRTPAPAAAAPAVPVQRGRLRRRPAPEPAEEPRNVPPHLAGLDELGTPDGVEPDWWRVGPGAAALGSGPQVEGFAGGIEFPAGFGRGGGGAGDADADEDAAVGGTATRPPAGPSESRTRRAVRVLRARRERRRQRKAAAAAPEVVAAPAGRSLPHAFLLLAAALLTAGALTGYWMLLAVGWLVAYGSRVLGPTERKWVVLGVPGAIFTGAVLWLWGRRAGRWGEALADDGIGAVFHGMWPGLIRWAAVATAAYLLWRSRRRG
ncbi:MULTISPECIES: hypothetical protein [unclassified Streptomyces]|uniref:hypothetical protein n=1 Tax=unclassified Streptomyces TaxID=2593676 RepID=UPI003662CF74